MNVCSEIVAAARNSSSPNFSWSTFLASLAASILVGFLLFVLGQRHSKNQADRQSLKELYRELVVHFEAMLKAAEDGFPLRASDFYARRKPAPPPVEDLRMKGRLHEVPRSQELIDAEAKALSLAARYESGVRVAYRLVVDVLAAVARRPLLLNSETPETSTAIRTEGAKSQEYVSAALGSLLVESEFQALVRRLHHAPAEVGLQLHWRRDDARNEHDIWIAPAGVEGGLVIFLRTLRDRLDQQQEVANALLARTELIAHLSSTLEWLRQRLQDPHPMWETVHAGMRDLFRLGG